MFTFRAMRAPFAISATVFLAGCTSLGPSVSSSSPFLTLPAPIDGSSALVLLAAIEGRIVESNGCLVLNAEGSEAAVVFAHGFSIDRDKGIISDGLKDGQTQMIGRTGRFSGSSGKRAEVEAKLGMALPDTCPANVVQIDEIKS